MLSTATIPFQSRWLNYIHYTHYTLFIKIYIYTRTSKDSHVSDFAKFSCIPTGWNLAGYCPAHSRRFIPWMKSGHGLPLQKHIREDSRRFRLLFFPLPLFSWNTILHGSSFEKKKKRKKKEESPTSPSLSRIERGARRRSNGGEREGGKEMKKGRRGQSLSTMRETWTPPSKTRTNPELGHHLVNVDRFTNIRGREQTVEERFYEIFNLQTSITIYATANHPDPCQTAPPFLRTFCHVSSHDSSSAIRHMDPRLRTETRCIKLSCRYIR